VQGTPPIGLEKEARLIARLSSQYALTCDLAMGLLGGKLKRMELLSARLGDVLAHLYMASASLWRYAFERDADMLPVARAAIRVQLDQAGDALEALYANFPSPLQACSGCDGAQPQHAPGAASRCSIAGTGQTSADQPRCRETPVP
jgi:acyl-CoA dehydrogenase